MGEVATGISLAEIHQVMNELLDKQVKKERLKYTSRVHVSSHKPTKKCAMKMKETNDMHVKILLMESKEGIYRVCVKNLCHGYQRASNQ